MIHLRIAWNRPARLPDGVTEHVLLVGVTPQAALSRLPGNFCLLLDCSGSMEGQKLEDARAACRLAFGCLQEDDLLSVVAFSSSARPVLTAQNRRDLTETALNRHLEGLAAQGTTRLDLALSEARKALAPNMGPDRTSAVLLVTDGHPTNPQGRNLKDCSPFLDFTDRLAAKGIALITIGLGSARNYNSGFLTDLGDRGRGRFCHAAESAELGDILAGEIRAAQSTVISGLEIAFRSRREGTEVTSFCRIAPQFMPFDAAPCDTDGSWRYPCGSLQSGPNAVETIFLARVDVQGAFGIPSGSHAILDVEASWQPPTGQRTSTPAVTASLNFTTMMREQQVVDEDVERLRLLWDVNAWQDELSRTADPRRTADLLGQIAAGADQAGRPDAAADAHQQLDDLKRTGKLDADRLTRSRHDLRNTGRL